MDDIFPIMQPLEVVISVVKASIEPVVTECPVDWETIVAALIVAFTAFCTIKSTATENKKNRINQTRLLSRQLFEMDKQNNATRQHEIDLKHQDYTLKKYEELYNEVAKTREWLLTLLNYKTVEFEPFPILPSHQFINRAIIIDQMFTDSELQEPLNKLKDAIFALYRISECALLYKDFGDQEKITEHLKNKIFNSKYEIPNWTAIDALSKFDFLGNYKEFPESEKKAVFNSFNHYNAIHQVKSNTVQPNFDTFNPTAEDITLAFVEIHKYILFELEQLLDKITRESHKYALRTKK